MSTDGTTTEIPPAFQQAVAQAMASFDRDSKQFAAQMEANTKRIAEIAGGAISGAGADPRVMPLLVKLRANPWLIPGVEKYVDDGLAKMAEAQKTIVGGTP